MGSYTGGIEAQRKHSSGRHANTGGTFDLGVLSITKSCLSLAELRGEPGGRKACLEYASR